MHVFVCGWIKRLSHQFTRLLHKIFTRPSVVLCGVLTLIRISLPLAGGNPRGVFGLALVQGEWKVYVSGLLDREQQDWYLLNITASDGLYVARTAVEVTVMDANDNSPICNQVRDQKIWKCKEKQICGVLLMLSKTPCFSTCLQPLFVSSITTHSTVCV